MEMLIKALLDGNRDKSAAEIDNLFAAGVSKEQIVTKGIEAAMEHLSAKCTLEQFNLLEIMLVGRVVTEIMKKLYPLDSPPPKTKATVVVASLEGDVHDLGKNILKTILIAKGYRVVDCGKDCPVENLVNTALAEKAQVIGVSGLVTTIIPKVKQIRRAAKKKGLGDVKILAGGAALKQSCSENLNVDYVAENAFEGVHYIDQILQVGK